MAENSKMAELARVEADLMQLRRAYERHWMGLEKVEPSRERDRLRAEFVRLRAVAEAQSALSFAFRVRTAQASFLSLDELCNRRTREREEGRQAPPRDVNAGHARAGAPLAASTTVAPPPAPAESPPSAGAWQALYAQLVDTLQRSGKQAPPPEAFAAQVQKFLDVAKQRAPATDYAARLQVHDDGRVQLVVEPKPSA